MQKKDKKKEKKRNRVIYYKDLLNDDFLGTHIKRKTVDQNFKFVHKNLIWRFFSFLIYYFLVVPIILFYTKFILRIKYVNKKAVKKVKKQNYFLFGNHSGVHDAFTPNVISLPTRNKLIVSPETVSMKFLKNFTQMLGALPVPTEISGMKQFYRAVEFYHKKHYNITIYPEAHIWPYYTGVRPFKDSSFGYPVSLNCPVFAFFTAYTEPKGFLSKFRKANITVYISDPIYPDLTKPKKQAQQELRDKVYEFMLEMSRQHSTFNYITYKPIEESPDYVDPNTKNKNDLEAAAASEEKISEENYETVNENMKNIKTTLD